MCRHAGKQSAVCRDCVAGKYGKMPIPGCTSFVDEVSPNYTDSDPKVREITVRRAVPKTHTRDKHTCTRSYAHTEPKILRFIQT